MENNSKQQIFVPSLSCSCGLCGAFVIVDEKKKLALSPHSSQQCPLSQNPGQLLSILETINQKLVGFQLDEIIKNSNLIRLCMRKALIEIQLHQSLVDFEYQGSHIQQFSFIPGFYEQQLQIQRLIQQQLLNQQQQQQQQQQQIKKKRTKIEQPKANTPEQLHATPKQPSLLQKIFTPKAQQANTVPKIVKNESREVSSKENNQDFNVPPEMFEPIDWSLELNENMNQILNDFQNEKEFEEDKYSERAYQQFLTSLNDKQTLDDDDGDGQFPIPGDHHDEEDEFLDPSELEVSEDELKDLYEIQDDDPAQPSLELETVQEPPLFSDEQYHEFMRQLNQNFQLVVQNMVISHECALFDSSWLTFWKFQLNDLDVRYKNQMSQLTGKPLLPGLTLYPEVFKLIQTTIPPSKIFREIVFNSGLTKSKKKNYQKSFPEPHSLAVLRQAFKNYFDLRILPLFRMPTNGINWREIEDQLLLHGLNEYGAGKGSWHLIKENMLPHRLEHQIMVRYRNATNRRSGNMSIKNYFFMARRPFSRREQMLLLQGVAKFGKNFHRISRLLLPDRPPGLIQQVWHTIDQVTPHSQPVLSNNNATNTSLLKDSNNLPESSILIVPDLFEDDISKALHDF